MISRARLLTGTLFAGLALAAPASAEPFVGLGCTSDGSGQVVFALASTSVAAGDIDGDGIDEWVAGSDTGEIVLRHGGGGGGGAIHVLGYREPVSAVAVVPGNELRAGGVLAAFERGGLAVLGADGEATSVLLDSSFRVGAVSVFDFEGDGRPEVVVGRSGGGVFVIPPGGDAVLLSDDEAAALDVGDVDGDGRPDIVVALTRGGVVALDTSGAEVGALDSPPLRSLCVADLEGDGAVELLGVDASGRVVRLDPATGRLRAFEPAELPLEGSDGPFVTLTIQAAPPELRFVRGDANADLQVDIGDAVSILGDLFRGDTARARCRKALDANDSGAIDISDAIFQLNFLFLGGRPIPPPYPEPGLDPTPDELPCTGE